MHSLYPYPARFPKKVVEDALRKMANEGPVLDPFAGSGTVAVESFVRGVPSFSYDLLPFIELLVGAKLAILKKEVNLNTVKLLSEPFEEPCEVEEWVRYWWPKEAWELVCGMRRKLREMVRVEGCSFVPKGPDEALAALMILYALRRVSLADDVVYKWFRSKKKAEKLKKLMKSNDITKLYRMSVERKLRSAEKIMKSLPRFRGAETSVRGCCDAVEGLEGLPERVELLLTSPPYLQAHEYVRSIKYEMLLLGLSEEKVKELANKEIPYRKVECSWNGGAFRRHREEVLKARPALVKVYDAYFCSLFKAFEKITSSTEVKTVAIFVGEATLGGVPVPIHEVLREFFESQGYEYVALVEDPIKRRRIFKGRNNANKDGIKVERLLVMKRA